MKEGCAGMEVCYGEEGQGVAGSPGGQQLIINGCIETYREHHNID
jgi:hypothetical protein